MNRLIFDKNDNVLLGIDVGSTTVKVVVVKNGEIIFSCYERHLSQVYLKTLEILDRVKEQIKDDKICISIAGSAGLGMANNAGIPFVQEVFATSETVKKFAPNTDVVIELGGEDAKVIFFKGVTDERMNGSCAGGTGAFIDQMATLLNVSVEELDELSLNYEKIYPIASRCGVFAKSDIQPLINDGARKEDIAVSIYQSVVNQTITGLAQGYEISGNVMFLGGPLYYCKGLRNRFVDTLKLSEENANFPEYGRLCVAIGSALYSQKTNKEFTFDAIDTANSCLTLFTGMLATMRFRKDVMAKSAMNGFTNATDAADYLVLKGVPFRDAHSIIGRLVLYCIEKETCIDALSLGELQAISDKFEADIYEAVSLETCVNKRLTLGAPGPERMKEVIALHKKYLEQ